MLKQTWTRGAALSGAMLLSLMPITSLHAETSTTGTIAAPSPTTTAISTSSPTVTTTTTSSNSTVIPPTTTTTTTGTPLSVVSNPVPGTPSSVHAALVPLHNEIGITWIDNASNETSFRIFRRIAGGAWVLLAEKTSDQGYSDVNVPIGNYYEYYVTACNSSGCSPAAFSSPVYVGANITTAATPTTTTTTTAIPTTTTSTNTASTTSATAPVKTYTTSATTTEYTPPPVTNLRGLKSIKGTLQYPDGSPVTDAAVSAYRKDTGAWINAYTDSSGKFQLAVGGGQWSVGIYPRDTALAHWTLNQGPQTVTFSTDTSTEDKVLDSTVQLSNAKLQVVTKSSSGAALANINIIIDTVSGSSTGTVNSTTMRRVLNGQTGTTGTTDFYLPPATYYVRVSLPATSDFVYPSEKQVSISAGGSQTVTITLDRQSVANTQLLSGSTKLSDGTPVHARVWAWSQEGGSAATESSSSGAFSLTLEANSHWHIGAGKDAEEGAYYKSPEIVVDTSTTTAPLELFLLPFTTFHSMRVAAPVTVTKSASQEVSAVSSDGASFKVPANAAASTGSVSVEIKPTVEAPPQAASQVVGVVYDVTVSNPAGQPVTQLSSAAEITIPYSDAELAAKKSSVEAIVPSYFDEARNTWVPVDSYTIDRVRHVIIVHTNHLTKFALLVNADTTPPAAPTQVVAVVSGGKISVSWNNPIQDFKNAKVYRSDKAGELGTVRAAVVLTNSFTDDLDLVDGTTYFYTVRAVDAAGNESNNTNSVPVIAVGTSPKLATLNGNTTLLLPPGQALKIALARDLKLGSSGDDVKALQQLLRDEGVFPNGLVTGFFGSLTKQAVIRFQEKYAVDILTPAGLTSGTGLVGPGTRKKINDLLGASSSGAAALPPGQAVKGELLRNLGVGSSGNDVTVLQQQLQNEGVYQGALSGYYGPLTKQAVIRFQEKYATEVLTPYGLSKGTGLVGSQTRKKMNELLTQ